MAISVCMATYDGQNFIEEQIESILKQLNPEDELIIVDDASKDNTVEIIKKFPNTNIRIYHNEINKGVVNTFSKALSLAKNEYIFMCDQDDIWMDNRVSFMLEALNKNNALVVSTNASFIDKNGDTIFMENRTPRLKYADSKKYFKNIINIFLGRAFYLGSAMAFNRYLLKLILPIPQFVEGHDSWIVMISNIIKSNVHLEKATLQRRIHDNNLSLKKRNLIFKLWARVKFIRSFFIIILRTLK